MNQNPFENLSSLWSDLEHSTTNGAASAPPILPTGAPVTLPATTTLPVSSNPLATLNNPALSLPPRRDPNNGAVVKENWLKKNKTWLILGGIGIVVAAVAFICYIRKNNVWGKKGQDDVQDVMGLPDDPTSHLIQGGPQSAPSMHPQQQQQQVPTQHHPEVGHVPPQGYPQYPAAGGGQVPSGFGAPFPGQEGTAATGGGPVTGQPWFGRNTGPGGPPAGGMQHPQAAQWSQGAPSGMPHPFQPQLPPQHIQHQGQQAPMPNPQGPTMAGGFVGQQGMPGMPGGGIPQMGMQGQRPPQGGPGPVQSEAEGYTPVG